MADDFLIKLENISHLFQIRKGHGLNQVNLELYPGEVVALMGVNGSGKTTLLNTIAEKISPQKGNFLKGKKWRPAYHFQVASSFNIETRGNIEEKRSFANWMNLAQFWDTELQNLSTGNFHKWQQMEHFLQLENTNLLLLDEAFAHMDRVGQTTIMENLKSWTREKESSVIWSTHDLEFACRWSDRILWMQRGKIIFNGTPEELLYRPPTIEVALAVDFGNLLVGYQEENLFLCKEGKLMMPKEANLGSIEKPIGLYILPEYFVQELGNSECKYGIEVEVKGNYFEHLKNLVEARSKVSHRKIKFCPRLEYKIQENDWLKLSLVQNAPIHYLSEI